MCAIIKAYRSVKADNINPDNIHTSNIIQMEQFIFRDICVYTHTNLHGIIFMKKRENEFEKELERGIWEGLQVREGRKECGNYIIISNTVKNRMCSV